MSEYGLRGDRVRIAIWSRTSCTHEPIKRTGSVYFDQDKEQFPMPLIPPVEELMERYKAVMENEAVTVLSSWFGFDYDSYDSDDVFGGRVNESKGSD